jgi:hypothetical protein
MDDFHLVGILWCHSQKQFAHFYKLKVYSRCYKQKFFNIALSETSTEPFTSEHLFHDTNRLTDEKLVNKSTFEFKMKV